MAKIRSWSEEAVTRFGEPLEAIVVGKHYRSGYDIPPAIDENVVLPPEAALVKLDHEFDSGYGGDLCFPILAWTASRVFFISEYDGATSLVWVPRHPVPIEPEFSGQSG